MINYVPGSNLCALDKTFPNSTNNNLYHIALYVTHDVRGINLYVYLIPRIRCL